MSVVADGRVFWKGLCIDGLPRKPVFTDGRDDMAQQEFQAGHDVPGTTLLLRYRLSSGCF